MFYITRQCVCIHYVFNQCTCICHDYIVDSGGKLQQLIHVESGDEGKTKLTIW